MARTPETGISRDSRVTVRFSPRETQHLDTRRGEASRSTYIRALVARDNEEEDA